MLTPARLVATTLIAILVSGCSLDSIWNDGPVRPPSATTVPETATATGTPSAEDTEEDPYTGALARGATCARASKTLLNELEGTAGVGAAITYPHGVVVKSAHGWWTVAVATAVHANGGGYTRDNVAAVDYFAATADNPSDGAYTSREVHGGTASAKTALACLTKLPPVKPDPEPEAPADTYSGKPSAGATCKEVPKKLLARLQEVGQVGGAINYPRGQMVRANRKWWTVAVATEVHPNGEGLTSANVAAAGFFVTNVPSLGSGARSGTWSFPIKGTDRAAARALACLGQ